MHEASLVLNLVRQVQEVAQAQGVSKVLAVRLKVGPLLHVSAEHLREHFALASRGSVAEGAHLVMEPMDGTIGLQSQSLVLDGLDVEED